MYFKLIMLITFISLSLSANELDKKVLDFEKNRFSKNSRIEIVDLSVNMKKQIPNKNWYGYIIDVNVKMAGKDVKAKDILFSNGEIVATELFDIKSGDSYKDLMTPSLTRKYYDEEKLIAGNSKAKDKIVIFSDPLCPFCMDFVPDVIKHVKKYEDKIALYYYHFPLSRIHPAAVPLVKLMVKAKEDGIKNIEERVYSVYWDEEFSSKEQNEDVIISSFNKIFKTSYTKKDINSKNISDEIFEDVSMGEEVLVQGTPTIFINGEQDKSKLKYEELGK
ncbi:disulfide bond formation protein DsbA [Halarcobacter mediterraneus]|uniref:Disulfide bond formation protein DsbA n=1 Tax=Halarcobacter mediterraneus TaxID=2023153 RepID=A0A4Q1B390_9BACT|nr:thioredoxin domain-containing protein [Halarcobacter mediterraneus]RXK12478.1 disulfide bond formation protein DsbA [Halarcobacter mediterraneus]